MKRHISIFAFLLSAFTAVGLAGAQEQVSLWTFYRDVDQTIRQSDGKIVSPIGQTGIIVGEVMEMSCSPGSGKRAGDWWLYENDWSGNNPQTQIRKIGSGPNCSYEYLAADGANLAVVVYLIKTYAITTSVSPTGVGTVSVTGGNGDGTVDAGGSVTLKATANPGWTFSEWQKKGDGKVGDRDSLEIKGIQADASYTAVFTRNVNSITSGPTISGWTYGDTPKPPSASAKYTGSTGMTYTYYDSGKTSLGSQPPTDAGTYYVTATSPSSDEGVSETSGYVGFTIAKASITGLEIDPVSAVWDGQPHQPTVVSVTANGKTYASDATGWTVAYSRGGVPTSDFISDGAITVRVDGKANLSGYQTKDFAIVRNTYAVTYAPGDFASGGNYGDVKKDGIDLTLRGTIYSRTGYTQDGWSRASDGSTLDFTLGGNYTENAAVALYPHWKANEYELAINPNGGVYDTKDFPHTLLEKLVYDSTNLNQILIATKADHSLLLGYWTAISGGKQVYDAQGRYVVGDYWTADGEYKGTANITAYAMWGEPKKYYDISVNVDPANAGSVEGGGTYEEGSNAVLQATANTGYSFCCWSNDNKVVSTENPWTNKVTAAATYTAVFTGNVYTVTFVGMGGLPAVTNVDVKVGEKWGKYFPSLTYLIDGWKLTGWYSDPLCTEGNRIADDAFVEVPPSSLTPPSQLYAKWEKIATYIIAYDGNGATSGTMTNETALCGEETTLTSNKYERTGYAFVGWTNIVKQAFYADGATVKDLADADKTATLSAVWQANTYTVTFDGYESDGGDEMSPQDFTYDVEQALASNTFTRTGKEFAGWATSKSGAVVYTNGERVVNLTDEDGATVQLFAKWANPSYSDNPLSVAADCDRERDDGRQPLDLISESTDCVSFDVADKGGNNKAVRMMPTSEPSYLKMEVQLSGSGTLKFHYRTSIPYKGNSSLKFVFNNDYVPDLECSTSVDDWTEYVRHYDAAEGTMARWSFEENIMNNDYALIDNIRWIPDGAGPEHPVPEKKNAVEIETAAFSDGKFKLEFESDAQFDYNLLTNANLLIDSWGKMGETKEGTGGTITFEPEIIEGQPQLFYKVETIQKK